MSRAVVACLLTARRSATVLSMFFLMLCAIDASAITLPKTRHVGPSATNCDYSDIASAIAASNSGDTIVIDGGGSYTSQHLLIADKSLALAAGPCQPIIGGRPEANAQVTLSGDAHATSAVITITGTSAVTLTDLKITGNTNSHDGGGIEHTSSGKLTLNNVLVTGNSAGNGGGVDVSGAADLVIGNDTQIIGNTATLAGGGVRFASTGTLTMAGSGNLIASNDAAGFGGGLYVFGGTADITASGIGTLPLFSLNTAYAGGAIAVRSTATQLAAVYLGDVNTAPIALDNNSATQYGGAVYVEPYQNATVQLAASFSGINVRITRNSASDGAAAYVACPNGNAATCDVGGNFALGTDSCNGVDCSTVYQNTASSPNGAVITLKKGLGLIQNTRVYANSGAYVVQTALGAGVQISESIAYANQADQSVFYANTGSFSIAQSTIADNTGAFTRVINATNATFTLLSSIISANVDALAQTGGTLTVQDVVGSNVTGLPANVDVVLADPLFVNAANGDYRLRVTSDGKSFIASPAVDFSAHALNNADIDGRARPADVGAITNRFGAFDLGAFEMQPITDRVFANSFGDQYLLAN